MDTEILSIQAQTQPVPAFSLRPLLESDEEFSYRVYASTRVGEMALVNWSGEQKSAFLRMQFEAQRDYYHLQYPHALWQVVELGSIAAGRLVSDDSDPRQFLLMDIALLPEFRGRGVGTALLGGMLRTAGKSGKVVVLHVEPDNPALRLYRRLGFIPIEQSGFYLEMRWGNAGKLDAGTF